MTPSLRLTIRMMKSTFLLGTCLRNRTMYQEDLNLIHIPRSHRQTVLSTMNNLVDHILCNARRRQQSNRFIGLDTQGRGQTILQTRAMATVQHTHPILAGILIHNDSIRITMIRGPTLAAVEAQMLPIGHIKPRPLILYVLATFSTRPPSTMVIIGRLRMLPTCT